MQTSFNNSFDKTVQTLSRTLSEEYVLMLKTQNFHWNIEGPLFFSMHSLLGHQYKSLGEKVDSIAETIRAYGSKAPGSFRDFLKTALIDEAPADPITPHQMIEILNKDHLALATRIKEHREEAEKAGDVHAIVIYEDLISFHEKASWMIRSHRA